MLSTEWHSDLEAGLRSQTTWVNTLVFSLSSGRVSKLTVPHL